MANQDFSDLLAAEPGAKPAAAPPAAGNQPTATAAGAPAFDDLLAAEPGAKPSGGGAGNVDAFVRQYAPLAQRVSRQVGVAPEALLGQWGLETGWGKSVIPGTNNLGNIKDFSGRGVQATDNMTGSRDGYRAYDNAEAFGDDFAGLLARRYKSAIGAGSDPQRYFSALKMGGYAEDPDYISKGVAAAKMAAQSLGARGQQTERDPYTNTQAQAKKERGLVDQVMDVGRAVWQGAKSTTRNVAATGNTYLNNLSDVEVLSAAQQADAENDPQAMRALRDEIERRKQENPDASIWQAVGDVFGAAWGNKAGTVQTVANQLPNSAVALGGGWAGAKAGAAAGSVLGPAGTVVGGALGFLGGMFLGNMLLETGGKAQEKAADGFTPEERQAAIEEGAVKAGVITAVDTATLGAGRVLSRTLNRTAIQAGARAEAKVIADAGIDISNGAKIVDALAKNPQLREAATRAGQQAAAEASRFSSRAATVGTLGAMETAGEGTGEYLGELAATGKADPYDAAFESLAGFAQSAPEVFWSMTQSSGNNMDVSGISDVAKKAMEPNSPLSKAALAGANTEIATGANQQPEQAQAAAPAERLAELRSRVDSGQDLSAEEVAEYQSLKKLSDDNAALRSEGVEQADEIGDRARAIDQMLRTNNGLEALRSENSPITVREFLADLSRAKSRSTPAAAREQSLARLESAAEWMGFDLSSFGAAPQSGRAASPEAQAWVASRSPADGQPVTPQQERAAQASETLRSADLTPQERREAIDALNAYRNPNLPDRARRDALSRALEVVGRKQAPAGTPAGVQTPAVLQDIPPQPNTPEFFIREAERRENGAFQFRELGYNEEADALQAEADSLRESAASARAGELGMEDAAQGGEGIAAPATQQTVDQATAGLPRAQIQPEAPGAPAADNTAARRKRKAQLRQLADIGFDTVERGENGFVLNNSKTGQAVTLESPADAAMARAAIKESVDAKAHTAAASPLNDRREPTPAQIKAGNYKKSDVIEMNGVKVVIENPKGSVRRGVGADGTPWETTMKHHYGEIVGTEGADGDRVDVFIGDRPDSSRIWIVDQVNEDGSFDEHKVIFGALDEAGARRTYLDNYDSGWTGLGAISEMTQDQFKSWLRADGGKKPAAGHRVEYITVDGKQAPIEIIPADALPDIKSAKRIGNETEMDAQRAKLLQRVADLFGKQIVFFRDLSGRINADGFVAPGNDNIIYANRVSTINGMSIFGHELTHLLERDMPEVYTALKKVVAERVKDPAAYRQDYYGSKSEKDNGDPLSGRDLNELTSDLVGNLFTQESFWSDLYAEIERTHPGEARSLIERLLAYINKLTKSIAVAFKGQPQFRAEQFVSDIEAIRAAATKAMAAYAADRGIKRSAMQANVLREENKLGDIKRSAKRPDDGLTVEAYHYSQQPRSMLSTGMYGSGLQGSDRDAILAHPDKRLRNRLYFYVNKGTGVRPESGVGGIAHKATLSNIYDADADLKRLKEGRDKRAFESAVLDAGYSGYLSRLEGSQPGQVILLGQQTVTPEVLGPRTQIPEAKVVPQPSVREMNLGDRIQANKALPSGAPTLSRWAQILMATMPQEAAQLMEAGVFDGKDENLYRDEFVARVRRATKEIQRSTKRAAAEYAAVEAKYRDTDAWMKAPNGEPTNLTERQWVQVRTPSFMKWFGNWEKHARADNPVGSLWSDDGVSKVVDKNGEPLVVYHGSDKGGFMQFEEPGGSGRGDLGIFTTDNFGMARSYVRKNRINDITPIDNKSAAEGAGVEFFYYMGRTSSKQTEDQQLFGYTTPYGDEVDGFQSMDDAVADAVAEYADSANTPGSQPGVYALFLNIRNPNESDFEGAAWNGDRFDQYQVIGEDGEQLYAADGRSYLSKDEADALAQENPGSEVQQADQHYETTDDVVSEARRSGNDGAIIRQVIDDGGGPSSYASEPADVFVALKPEQIKSADFNGGEFSEESRDIRRSAKRGQDPADGDKTDVSKLPQGRPVPQEAAIGGLGSSLELARSKSYRRGRDLKQDIQDRVLAAAKKARVNLSARTKEMHKFLAGMVVTDAKLALESNENAVGWYDSKVSRAIGALSTIHPEINTDKRARLAFLWALATTSNGLKVNKNFELAEQAYRAWKETGLMPTDIGIGNAAQAINRGMAQYNELSRKVGDERLLKFMSTQFSAGEIERMLDVSVNGEWKSTPVRGAAILGPKIGNGFFSNLNGYFDALTMDRWLMRTWGRMTGTLLEVSSADIAETRDKLTSAINGLSADERKTIAGLVGKPLKKKLTRAETDAIATASHKASMKGEKREVMMSSPAMDSFRKAANLHHMTMDGQKEAPSGPAERNWIRAVFSTALEQLRADGLDMTMSDLQALLWYPERRLYDAAKSEDDVTNGYEDDEAPDYANAAYDLAVKSGVSDVRVRAAMDAAEARGTVQGEPMTAAEKAAMLKEFRAAPAQGVQLMFEVAPDPNDAALTRQWGAMPMADRAEITRLVKDAILKDVVDAIGVEVTKTVSAMGGYAGITNPNLIAEYKRSKVTIEDARGLAASIGMALDQDSVAVVDPRATGTAGIVRITLSTDASRLADRLFDAIRQDVPEIDAFTARGKNFDVLNFTAIPTEELAARIESAISALDDDVEAAISYGESKSELIEKVDYESHIKGSRPESWQGVRAAVERARDRARAIVAAELGRRAIEVPGSAAAVQRTGAGAETSASSDGVAVRDEGGVRRSARRLDVESRKDSRPEGREEDGSLIGLPRDFTVAGQKIAASHWAPAESVARKYMADAGLEYNPPRLYAKVDPERAKRIAAEYDKLKHDPQNPDVKAAYAAMAKETIAQYQAVIDSGLKVEFIDFARQGDPYAASPRLMTEDVRNNNHMWLFSTRDGFGSDAEFDPVDNPLLAETEFEISGQKALVNDLFRCFVAGTLVRTRSGFVPIELIKEGDEVLTHKGRYRRVVATMQRQHDGEVVDVMTNASHTPITATADHAFYVLQGNHDRRKKTPCTPYICGRKSSITGKFTNQDKLHEFAWKEIGSLPEGTWFPMVTDNEVLDLEYVSVPERFISERSRGPAAFALTPEFLWVVGLYIAEGSAGDNVISFALNANEMHFAERIEKFVRGSGYGRSESGGVSISANGENGMYVKINSATLSKWFPAWLGSGAANKAIPKELMRLPAEKLQHLAKGIMDGDGRKKCGSIEQTSLTLALQLMEVGSRLGFQPTARAAHHDGDQNHSTVYGVHEVIEAKHENKQKKYTWKILGQDCRQIKSISRRHFSGVVYDIEVEEDHSFVVQNVPVHNCVHDYFGHVKEGVGFRADGEENTWRAHSSMFSPLAQRALTTETRGQNSWVNYGPHGEANRKAGAAETHYADQKVGLLPEWVSEDGRSDPTPAEYNQRIDAIEELIRCLRK